ncbi:MAG: response regulator transcription factor [Xanthobacter sp.]
MIRQEARPVLREVSMDPERCVSQPWIVHVVDDDSAVCNALKFTFELDGFDVKTYASSGEVLAAELPRHGCMVVDYNLPDINGLDLLRTLDQRNVHLPAFLITTSPSHTIRNRATALGVEIIEKPLLSNQLADAVLKSFSRRPCC